MGILRYDRLEVISDTDFDFNISGEVFHVSGDHSPA